MRFEEGRDIRTFHDDDCVLGHQGFSTTGGHYWEVEVGEKTAWRLGCGWRRRPKGAEGICGHLQQLLDSLQKSPRLSAWSASTCFWIVKSFSNVVTMAPIYTFPICVLTVLLFRFYNPCETDDVWFCSHTISRKITLQNYWSEKHTSEGQKWFFRANTSKFSGMG